jgi:hypothetical protein
LIAGRLYGKVLENVRFTGREKGDISLAWEHYRENATGNENNLGVVGRDRVYQRLRMAEEGCREAPA